jgi:1-acyl-sn-glycerol-3-phosphate acyltransferase
VSAELTRIEKLAVAFGKLANESELAKRLQTTWMRSASWWWVRPTLNPRLYTDGLDRLHDYHPERGTMVAANHRSYFDQYAILLAMWAARIPWARDITFPVRANFFYEHPLGVLVNAFVVGGAMYPPIFRQKERTKLNDDSLDAAIRMLQRPRSVVGVHPEGTRGKGDDPYELLPAQPGVGKMALLAQPMVLPVFVGGISNDFLGDVREAYTKGIRQRRPAIIVYGTPIDMSDLYAQKPRPTLYKKAADRMMAEIAKLGVREKELRARAAAGEISDDDPNWLMNRPVNPIDRFYVRP